MADLDVGHFYENPLIQALGTHLGMAGLFAEKGETPPIEVKPPAVGINETEKVRESRNARQNYARPSSGRGFGLGGNQPNAGMNLPGVMSPDVLMHPMVQQLLGQYGVTPEQLQQTVAGANPNLFLSKDFITQHPRLGGALEGGLEGAAFTHGGATPGESISNVAQGMLNAKAARADKYNNQLMMPFAQAQQVAGLKGAAGEQALKEAQLKYDQAHANYWDQMGDVRNMMATTAQQREQDLAKHQQDMEKLTRQTHNLALMKDLQTTPFNATEQEQYQKLIPPGGDPLDADPAAVQALINTAAQRKLNEAQAGKETVARIAGNSRITAAGTVRPTNPAAHTYDDAKSTWGQAQKELNAFDKQAATMPFMMTDADGNKLNSTTKRQAYRTQLAQKVAAAKAEMDRIANTNGQIVFPGTGMTSKPKGRVYDPGTDSFH